MATEGPAGGSPAPKPSQLPTWGRIGTFILNLLRLENSVEALKKENAELLQRIDALQSELDKQSGQLRVLSDFVSKALDDRVKTVAAEAAVNALERVIAVTGLTLTNKEDE